MVQTTLKNIIDSSKSFFTRPRNLALTAMAAATIMACSKGDDGPVIPPEPKPIEGVFNRTVPTGRGGEVVKDYVNGKVLAQGTTDASTKIANYSFTQTNYDNLRSLGSKGASTGKTTNAITIDSTVVTNDNKVVATIGSQTITDTNSTADITNTKDLWSHEFLWYGNDSEATGKFYKNGELIGTVKAQDNVPLPTSIRGIIYDSSNTSTWDSIVLTAPPIDGINLEKIVAKNITIGEFLEYKGGTGPEGGYEFVPEGYGEGFSFAIVPLNEDRSSTLNTIVYATNLATMKKDSVVAPSDIAIFNNTEPGNYEITIKSNEINKPFFATTENVTVADTPNQKYDVILDEVQPNQDITIKVRDFDNLTQFVSDYTIELKNKTTDALIASANTDGTGQVTFEDVPENTEIYVVGSKSGFYTKTNDTHAIQRVRYVHEADTVLNVLANQKINYLADGKPVEAEIINWYLPKQDNTQMAKDELIVYFPEADQQDTAIEHLTNAANLVGLENFTALDKYSQFQGYPNNFMIETYDPFPGGETFPGLITTNVTSYFGGATTNAGKLLSNGRIANIYTTTFNLGGTEALDHHEFGNLNWPLIDGNITLSNGEFFITSRSSLASEIVQIDESKWDETLMPYTLQMQKNHYTQTDSEGRPIEYSMPTKFE